MTPILRLGDRVEVGPALMFLDGSISIGAHKRVGNVVAVDEPGSFPVIVKLDPERPVRVGKQVKCHYSDVRKIDDE